MDIDLQNHGERVKDDICLSLSLLRETRKFVRVLGVLF